MCSCSLRCRAGRRRRCSRRCRSSVADGRALLGAYLVCVIPALLVAAGQPIWSRVDEAQHWDFIAQLAHGNYPVEGRTLIRQETLGLMALALARRLFPADRVTGWLSVTMLAILPGVLLNGTQVTNDTLATVLGAATLLAAVTGRREGWPVRWQLLAGALFGAAMLTKLTTIGL